MLFDSFKKILDLLSRRERREVYVLFFMIFVMALLDMTGVASIMPFLSVLANPGVVETNQYLAAAYRKLGYSDPGAFLYFLGIVVFVLLIASILVKVLTTYFMFRFSHMRNYSLGRRLIAGYLHQPYEWYLNRHSADLAKSVLSEVDKVVQGSVFPAILLIAYGSISAALIFLLLAVNPWLAVVMSAVLGGTYGLIYLSLRGYLLRIGSDRLQANEARFLAVQEAFGGMKELKIGGLESEFIRRFDVPAHRYAENQATSLIASHMPRYVLEGVAFGGLFLLVLSRMDDTGGLGEALPLIGLYALAGYRLLPALQAVYLNLAYLRFTRPALESLHADIQLLGENAAGRQPDPIARPLVLQRCLELQHITYRYPGTEKPSLDDLSLKVAVNTTIGIVGSSGSGKTTTVDMILGLLRPDTGNLVVDDVAIENSNVRAWQRSIGYVPQQIYLSDASLAANIAFGLPEDKIDSAAVEQAARVANLHDFVVAELPDGYATTTGERGVRLSGGQRQRIGIARALYHDPELLIFDEATSALDNVTELAVIDAVSKLAREKTIIMIAHRLSTVRECDEIFLLDRGRVETSGTYQELIETSDRFRAMAE